jgi:hypothetical protein
MKANTLHAPCLCSLGLIVVAVSVFAAPPVVPCRVEVVDKSNGWPVPLVQLRTVHEVPLVTDNAGVIALDLPELMGRETWFAVHGHGYEAPKDGFGYRGVRLTPQAGKTLKVEVTRTNLAKRLGRLTGGGLFAESQKLGGDATWQDGPILGCDSVQSALYQGKRFWLWGDTNVPRYPLGIFHSSSATTSARPIRSFEPPLKVEFDYFKDDRGAPRGVAQLPGKGPTWITAYVTLPDQDGKERLVASYMKVKAPLEAYERGLCVWNEATASFSVHKSIWKKSDATPKPPPLPDGHPAFWTDPAGKRWVLFGNPLPTLRCPATFEAWQDPTQWEALTPQAALKSVGEGKPVKPHSGSIAWHAWRKRWVTVFMESFGKPSAFGELWYAEADAPTGPWGPCIKVLSHDNYTFYNPRLHADLTPPDSPILLFEGTYTRQFANKPEPTPRYDYNQMLYRLDLDEIKLEAR